jgi:cytochrome c
MLAPPLSNVIGRPAASVDGFNYSDIIKIAGRKGLVWSAEALDQFLDRPEVFMPGTYMAFPGIDQPERADVIAYLLKLTKETNEAARKAAAERAMRGDEAKGKAPPPQAQPQAKPSPRPSTERRNPYIVQ